MENGNNQGLWLYKEMSPLQKAEFVQKAALVLNSGGVMIAPTETVYGLFCIDKEKIYEIKQRPKNVPFQLIGGLAQNLALIDRCAEGGEQVYALAKKFWPGPLSIVCKTIGLGEQALRVPDFALLEDIFALLQYPLFASSLNLHGQIELTTFLEIKNLFESIPYEKIALFEDVPKKLASTVIKIVDNQVLVLREGLISKEDIAKVN